MPLPPTLAPYEERLIALWERLATTLGSPTVRVLLDRAIWQTAQRHPDLALRLQTAHPSDDHPIRSLSPCTATSIRCTTWRTFCLVSICDSRRSRSSECRTGGAEPPDQGARACPLTFRHRRGRV